MRGIAHGFNAGIELMHQATVLGSSAQTQLPKPNYQPLAPRSSKSSTSRTHQARSLPTPSAGISRPSVPTDEETITFRTLAEDIATQNDLLFLPIGKSHQQTGKPLFRVSKTVDGKGGVTVYVGQDAVFAQMDDGAFRAVSLDDMVKRASS
jgi:tuftelin-interacting protein 11